MSNPAGTKPSGTILLTGASGTIGSAIASRIASSPALSAEYHGLYTARKAETASELKSALYRSHSSSGSTSPHPHDILSLDLSDLSAVRDVAAKINARVASGEIPPLRALILNAGYLEFTEQRWTEDGFDMTFATNYLGHWLLAMLLLQSMDKESGRIVFVTSESYE
ncbi:unnamed protein product [Clonostachys rosea f. rosea IK726]|jgi:NAD(P)-dependent dehydrogenase (short-subunit alcohol dehydrogenase family)|uniref:Uncharacterized protein n=1 Tax=Clonostachys rosea f. rosea IK726 TaxID=1349383 RepID=A0ACA9TGT6_BIOOC|nr:unnamed protein product [Clonostachys rosea f. rosea IK726]